MRLAISINPRRLAASCSMDHLHNGIRNVTATDISKAVADGDRVTDASRGFAILERPLAPKNCPAPDSPYYIIVRRIEESARPDPGVSQSVFFDAKLRGVPGNFTQRLPSGAIAIDQYNAGVRTQIR